MADLAAKLKKQVEFYFGDSNFPKDKFLRAQAAINEEGYVPIATLCTFNRMKELSTDLKAIADAIRDSKVVALNSEGTMIKRKNPVPETDDSVQRTIYAKGFSKDATIEDIANVFNNFGTVLSVRIRKMKDRTPKESAFIEFSAIDEANKAVKEPPKFKDNQLIILSRQAYTEKKKEERKQKKRKTEGEENQDEDGEQKSKKQKTESKKEDIPDVEHPKGVVISFKEIGTGVTREVLKDLFGKYGGVAFVDFSQNESSGYVRMNSPEEAQKAMTGIKDSKVEIGAKIPEIAILADDEENAYWDKIVKSKADRKANQRRKGGNKKRKRF